MRAAQTMSAARMKAGNPPDLRATPLGRQPQAERRNDLGPQGRVISRKG